MWLSLIFVLDGDIDGLLAVDKKIKKALGLWPWYLKAIGYVLRP